MRVAGAARFCFARKAELFGKDAPPSLREKVTRSFDNLEVRPLFPREQPATESRLRDSRWPLLALLLQRIGLRRCRRRTSSRPSAGPRRSAAETSKPYWRISTPRLSGRLRSRCCSAEGRRCTGDTTA